MAFSASDLAAITARLDAAGLAYDAHVQPDTNVGSLDWVVAGFAKKPELRRQLRELRNIRRPDLGLLLRRL